MVFHIEHACRSLGKEELHHDALNGGLRCKLHLQPYFVQVSDKNQIGWEPPIPEQIFSSFI